VHEVIVETNDSRQQWDLSVSELKELLLVYSRRISELSKVDGVKYVQVFKNNGPKAGCSIQHSHSQVIALNIIPPAVVDEENSIRRYEDVTHKNAYDSIISKEINSYRDFYHDANVLAICPYASIAPFEVKIVPLRHVVKMDELNFGEIESIATVLQKVLSKLKTMNMPYNMYIRYGLNSQRFYIDILPRPSIWAGFEMSTGIIINPVPPEDAAKFYRSIN
jgi:UDPglucose--hexose-1-phosphate uridylyltransferase